MKKPLVIFDFAGTLVKMRPPSLLLEKGLIVKLSQSYFLGILTGGKKAEVLNILNKLDIKSYFQDENIITKDETNFRKPNPQLLQLLTRNTTCVAYIGDTCKDSQMAKAVGVRFILADKSVAQKINELLLSGGLP